MIAGPNGAGKTTFARSFLPAEAACIRFINADMIAAGLSPFAPETMSVKAGRLMLTEIDECVSARKDFAFETTLSGLGYLKHIKQWRQLGYHVSVFYLSLSGVELAIARVAERVRQGGHNIPDTVIRRRYAASQRNFFGRYADEVDAWAFFDNSGITPQLISWGENA